MNLNIFFRELTGIDYRVGEADRKMVIIFKVAVYLRGKKQ
jgi:hypothetical protein